MNCSNYEFQFMKAVSHFPHDTLQAFEFYKMIYNEIPMSEKLNVLLRIIYSEFEIDSSIIDWIYKCLTDETPIIRQQRISNNVDILKDYIKQDNTITVYRGISKQNYAMNGISYSLDKLTSEIFALNGSSSKVITAKVHINDILAVNLNINEFEIYCFPTEREIVSLEIVYSNAELSQKYIERSRLYDKQVKGFVNKMENNISANKLNYNKEER